MFGLALLHNILEEAMRFLNDKYMLKAAFGFCVRITGKDR